ncbi:MAG TPA: flagellar hook-basal body complex protein [Stenomitos sp.]
MSDVRITAQNSIGAVDNWLKALAGNLTGSNVTGFRQTKVLFEDVLTQTISAGSPATQGSTNYGSINPIQFSEGGTAIKATRTDFSQGALQGTQRPTDLALTGNGFFVLSKVKNPQTMNDLIFTRNGSFTFDLEPDPTILDTSGLDDAQKQGLAGTQSGVLRLVNQDGYYVMGVTGSYQNPPVAGIPGTSLPPNEATTPGGSLDPLKNGLDMKPFSFPFIKVPDPASPYNLNADLIGRFSFNRNGQLTHTGTLDVPDSTDDFEKGGKIVLSGAGISNSGKINKYVSVASFATPDGLLRSDGSQFQWAATAGPTFMGVAGVTDTNPAIGNRTVGSSNEIAAGSLETSNSSVNTALPELTIAQKSFTANVKIVSVGNTLIDDVNQLIR